MVDEAVSSQQKATIEVMFRIHYCLSQNGVYQGIILIGFFLNRVDKTLSWLLVDDKQNNTWKVRDFFSNSSDEKICQNVTWPKETDLSIYRNLMIRHGHNLAYCSED